MPNVKNMLMFNINEKIVKKINGDLIFHQILTNINIPRNGVFCFKIKVLETKTRDIGIGVVEK